MKPAKKKAVHNQSVSAKKNGTVDVKNKAGVRYTKMER